MGNNKESVNLCHQAGCPDICCHNMWFEGIDRKERQTVFPEAKEVNFDSPVESYPPGAYILRQHKGMELLYIKGPCQHLVETGCDGIGTSFCEGLVFGGNNCNRMRIKSGLGPIDRNGDTLPEKKKSFAGFLAMLFSGGE